MIIKKLYLNDEKFLNVFIHIYQQKTDFIFFVIIIIKLNVDLILIQNLIMNLFNNAKIDDNNY